MKVCLATVPQNAKFIPLALLYLKAWLVERCGCPFDDIDIVEVASDAPDEELLARVLAGDPDVVGLSCYLWNVACLTRLAARIKAVRPRTRIVLGGPEVGPIAASVLAAHPAIDVIVRSEGEVPFGELVLRWRDCDPIDGVRGISFRDGDRIAETEDAPLVKDVNEIPSPHLTRYGDWTGRIICLETQRGCVFRCNFCFYNKDLTIRNRRFDLERVKQEIGFWLGREIGELYLMDPVFNLYAERAKEILRFIAGHNTRGTGVHAEVWAEFIDEEMARLMRDAHVTFLEVGLQTTDESVLATVERRLKMKQFVEGLGHLKRFGVRYELHLIHGLPGETPTTFRRSLNFAMSFDPPDIAVFPLLVLPGTELWRKAEAMHLRFNPDPPHEVQAHYSMGEGEINHGRQMSEAVHELFRSRTLRLLAREPGITYADIIEEWIAWTGHRQGDEPFSARARAFVSHVCETRQVPGAFYAAFAAREFLD